MFLRFSLIVDIEYNCKILSIYVIVIIKYQGHLRIKSFVDFSLEAFFNLVGI